MCMFKASQKRSRDWEQENQESLKSLVTSIAKIVEELRMLVFDGTEPGLEEVPEDLLHILLTHLASFFEQQQAREEV